MNIESALPANEFDGLPLVGQETGNRPLWIGLAGISAVGVSLFFVLESRRESAEVPAVSAKVRDYGGTASAMPELYVPPEEIVLPAEYFNSSPTTPNANRTPQNQSAPRLPPVVLQTAPKSQQRVSSNRSPIRTDTEAAPKSTAGVGMLTQNPGVIIPPPLPSLPFVNNTPTVIYDMGVQQSNNATSNVNDNNISSVPVQSSTRIRAKREGNWNAMVQQGSIIPAVLETAIDSTQPGQARALVSKDILSLKGTKVLIPRGSRLFGDYKADLASGQNRIQIQWARLVRPDGVTIALNSPATDVLGRAGLKGDVNTHFFQTLSFALLQSSLDIASNIASRAISSDSGVILAVPTSTQSVPSGLFSTPPKPTISIKQGSRISVLVSRDLDFSIIDGLK
jgi:type IV secretion system protein VirB10